MAKSEILSGKLILAVDDEEDVLEIIEEELTDASDCTLHKATTFEKAQQYLVSYTYDLVILDYHMPGMDGLEVARIMEQAPALRKARRIILTSVDQSIREEERRVAGISAWLTKPVRSSQLYDCLATEMQGTNVLVNAMCPGWVRTDMGGPRASRSVEEGADTAVWLATLPDDGPQGGYFRDRKAILW